LFVYILLLGLLGSAAQILWLLARGVNVEEWNKTSRLQINAV
jgi:hypothetical protein